MTIAKTMTPRDLKLVTPGQLTPEQLQPWDAYYEPRNEAFRKANLQGRDLVRWKYNRYMHDYLGCIKSVDESVGRAAEVPRRRRAGREHARRVRVGPGLLPRRARLVRQALDLRGVAPHAAARALAGRRPTGGVNRDLVSNLDFAETFLEAAGVAVPAEMQGRSLVPLLRGQTPADWRKSFYYHYYEFPGPHSVARHYGVVTDRYKLVTSTSRSSTTGSCSIWRRTRAN